MSSSPLGALSLVCGARVSNFSAAQETDHYPGQDTSSASKATEGDPILTIHQCVQTVPPEAIIEPLGRFQ
jgi:hypothetical protein